MLQQQIEDLKARLTAYARFVETMAESSVKGLLDRGSETLRKVVAASETKANTTEVDLERECTALIAQHQPKARDLRTILMVLGMTGDLERMGDHAVNIAEAGLSLLSYPGPAIPPNLPAMAREAIRMVDDAIRAFVSEDVRTARGVCLNDNVVDELAAAILKELALSMEQDPSTIGQGLSLLKIAGNLERIADLSTNICEDVIYLVEGRVIKHHTDDGP